MAPRKHVHRTHVHKTGTSQDSTSWPQARAGSGQDCRAGPKGGSAAARLADLEAKLAQLLGAEVLHVHREGHRVQQRRGGPRRLPRIDVVRRQLVPVLRPFRPLPSLYRLPKSGAAHPLPHNEAGHAVPPDPTSRLGLPAPSGQSIRGIGIRADNACRSCCAAVVVNALVTLDSRSGFLPPKAVATGRLAECVRFGAEMMPALRWQVTAASPRQGTNRRAQQCLLTLTMGPVSWRPPFCTSAAAVIDSPRRWRLAWRLCEGVLCCSTGSRTACLSARREGDRLDAGTLHKEHLIGPEISHVAACA